MKIKSAFIQVGLGARYALNGIGEFYRNPQYWRYAAMPLALLLAAYGVAGYVFWRCIMIPASGWIDSIAVSWQWLDLILAPVRWMLWLATFLLFLVALAMAVNTLYEMFGALFFARMTVRFERDRYGLSPARLPWRQEWLWNIECVIFAAVTFAIWFCVFLIGLWVPFVGPLLLVLCVGYRYGLSYLFNSGFNRNMSIGILRGELVEHRGLVRGFGAVIYLVMLMPAVPVLFIPGLTLGGSMLLNEGVYKMPPRRLSNGAGAGEISAIPGPK